MGVFPDGWDEVQSGLRAAVTADRPPRQIAGSFGVALFLVALPNLGVSLVLLGMIGYRIERADPRAFTAAALILNPLVKGSVYVASFLVGSAFLGPVPGGFTGLSLEMSRHVLARLLVGNLLLASAVGIAGYVLLRYTIRNVDWPSD
jgi:uncharacterized protein (DUF2062 family)